MPHNWVLCITANYNCFYELPLTIWFIFGYLTLLSLSYLILSYLFPFLSLLFFYLFNLMSVFWLLNLISHWFFFFFFSFKYLCFEFGKKKIKLCFWVFFIFLFPYDYPLSLFLLCICGLKFTHCFSFLWLQYYGEFLCILQLYFNTIDSLFSV